MRAICSAIVLHALAFAGPIAAQSFTLIEAPSDGERPPFVSDMSADGRVVVGSYTTTAGSVRAFRWTVEDGAQSLEATDAALLPERAYAISNDGTTIVGEGRSDNGREAFRWTLEEGVEPLGSLPGSTYSYASAVSDEGTVVGVSVVSGRFVAFVWTEAGGMEALEALGDYDECLARGVSADGRVVVGSCSRFTPGVGTEQEAFRWTRASGMDGLGTVEGGSGLINSFATDLSADGSVLVGQAGRGGVSQQFRWTDATGMVGLPFEFTYTGRARAQAVSADGAVVGGFDFEDPSLPVAVLWNETNGVVPVRDLLGGTQPKSFLLREVVSVAEGGQVAIGTGVEGFGSDTQSWRAEVTFPTTTEDEALLSTIGLAVYPNPAGATARVEVTVPEATRVHAAVYDVLGRRVALLHDGPLAAGSHPFNPDTAALPPGLYVVRAATPGATLTRRLTVVR